MVFEVRFKSFIHIAHRIITVPLHIHCSAFLLDRIFSLRFQQSVRRLQEIVSNLIWIKAIIAPYTHLFAINECDHEWMMQTMVLDLVDLFSSPVSTALLSVHLFDQFNEYGLIRKEIISSIQKEENSTQIQIHPAKRK